MDEDIPLDVPEEEPEDEALDLEFVPIGWKQVEQISCKVHFTYMKLLHPIAPNELLNRLCNSSTWSFWPIGIADMRYKFK